MRQRPAVELAHARQHGFLAIRRIDRRVVLLLELAHLDDHLRTAIDQLDELRIDRVDLRA